MQRSMSNVHCVQLNTALRETGHNTVAPQIYFYNEAEIEIENHHPPQTLLL